MGSRWCTAAPIRSEQIASGKDLTFSKIFVPFYREQVKKVRPKRLIDIGCGTGHLLSDLLKLNIDATGIDPSLAMIEAAKSVCGRSATFHVGDIESFKCTEGYDMAIAHLVAQCTDELQAFLSGTFKILKAKGVFSMTIPHPCFWNNYKKFIPTERYVYMKPQKVIAPLAITLDKSRPVLIPYIHRPIEMYMNGLIESGFQISRIQEIYPEDSIQALYGTPWKEPRYLSISAIRT